MKINREEQEINRVVSARLNAIRSKADLARFQRDFHSGDWFTSHPNCDPAVSAIRERMGL